MTQRPDYLEEDPAFITLSPPDVLARLLPDATLLHLEVCEVDDTAAQIILRVQSTQSSAPCPLCATPARRIHSDYGRTLADLPWAQYRVSLQLRVRKWFCHKRSCPRRIFTERLPTVAAPWARRTLRLAQRLIALGVALGGKAGGRRPGSTRRHAGGRPLSFVAESPGNAGRGLHHASRRPHRGQCREAPAAGPAA